MCVCVCVCSQWNQPLSSLLFVGPSSVTPSTTITLPPSSSTSSPTSSPKDNQTLLIAMVAGLTLAAVILCIIVCVIGQCFFSRHYKNVHRNDHNSIKTGSSPQPNISDITSLYSINTIITGSTNVDHASTETNFIKRKQALSQNLSNPPNSPITHRSVLFPIEDPDDCYSFVTRSEYGPPPPPPNPSINFDACSDKISSVSQRRIPAVLPHNGTSHYRVAPDYPQPPRQLRNYPAPPFAHYSQFHHIHHNRVPATVMEPDNTDEISFTSCETEPPGDHDYANTSLIDEGEDIDPLQDPGYYDPAPPPSPVTEFSTQVDEEERF